MSKYCNCFLAYTIFPPNNNNNGKKKKERRRRRRGGQRGEKVERKRRGPLGRWRGWGRRRGGG